MKIAVITVVVIVGFSLMVMPFLVRPPQSVEQPPGSDPRGPIEHGSNRQRQTPLSNHPHSNLQLTHMACASRGSWDDVGLSEAEP